MVPRRILSLAVRLVCGRGVYAGPSILGLTIVSVYILDEDNQTARLCRQGLRRNQSMLGVNTVDPDYRIACMYLGMDWSTGRVSNQSTRLESEDVHEKPLRSLSVLVNSQRNDAVGSPWRSFFLDLGRTQFHRRLYF